MTISAYSSAIVDTMLGWLKGFANWVLRLFHLAGSAGANPLLWLSRNWLFLLIVLMAVGGRLLVRRRPKGLLGGLYEFCAIEGHMSKEALVEQLAGLGFGNPRLLRSLPDSRHVFTHRVWRMEGWLAACDSAPEDMMPVDAAGFRALPFPSALRVYREIAEEALTDSE